MSMESVRGIRRDSECMHRVDVQKSLRDLQSLQVTAHDTQESTEMVLLAREMCQTIFACGDNALHEDSV